MEECEALCTRVGIMVKGTLKCLGPIQHLKNRLGEGYLLDINTAPSNLPRIKDYVARNFSGAKLAECHGGRIKFRLPKSTLSLAQIFREMETVKSQMGIEDYSINQTSLEQIFLSIASENADHPADDGRSEHDGGPAADGDGEAGERSEVAVREQPVDPLY
jgi:ABC-type multidrug transport system ATPase subunit